MTQVLGHQKNSGRNKTNSGSDQVLGLGSLWDNQVVGGSQSVFVETRFEVCWFLGTGVWTWFCGTKVLSFGSSLFCGNR